MKLEAQVVSLELAKRLKELNVKQESLFYWFEVKKGKWECWELIHLIQHWECCHVRDEKPVNKISAFTVAELGELLPAGIHVTKEDESWECLENFEDKNMANACAKMLIYLIKNNLLKL